MSGPYDMADLDRRFALADGRLVYCVTCGVVMPEVYPLMAAHTCTRSAI